VIGEKPHYFDNHPITFPNYITPSVSNSWSFDLSDIKFDHFSYLKICAKYYFFCYGLFYQYKIFMNDLNLAMFA